MRHKMKYTCAQIPLILPVIILNLLVLLELRSSFFSESRFTQSNPLRDGALLVGLNYTDENVFVPIRNTYTACTDSYNCSGEVCNLFTNNTTRVAWIGIEPIPEGCMPNSNFRHEKQTAIVEMLFWFGIGLSVIMYGLLAIIWRCIFNFPTQFDVLLESYEEEDRKQKQPWEEPDPVTDDYESTRKLLDKASRRSCCNRWMFLRFIISLLLTSPILIMYIYGSGYLEGLEGSKGVANMYGLSFCGDLHTTMITLQTIQSFILGIHICL